MGKKNENPLKQDGNISKQCKLVLHLWISGGGLSAFCKKASTFSKVIGRLFLFWRVLLILGAMFRECHDVEGLGWPDLHRS